MHIDLALILVVSAALTGAVWAVDAWVFAPRRARAGQDHEPVIVDWARTFFPIILLVLVVRSFLFEPFRIPSSSMVPTLLVGDFIFVNKYTFGVRLPVINRKIIDVGEPRRGDVVVFRYPSDTRVNYIKRVVGVPGDRILYKDKRLTINGELVELTMNGPYTGIGQGQAILGLEVLGESDHSILHSTAPDRASQPDFTRVVPPGHYFMMGDNRDNSRDSRYADVGMVPEANLVGKAVRIWMNWDFLNSAPLWRRIGDRIN